MPTTLIGIDCATDPAKVGLALGRFEGGSSVVEDVQRGAAGRHPADIIVGWLEGREGPTLFALDAPLGWPAPLAASLVEHQAGGRLPYGAHELFRRATDRFVREHIGKQSLDVGADRIARTAHSALDLLERLRGRLSAGIPLAWDSRDIGTAAIEVYPAATLVAHGIDARGYKAPGAEDARKRVLAEVRARVEVAAQIPDIAGRSDGVDAVICLLAAQDFLSNRAYSPPAGAPVRKEGWIWVWNPGAQ